MIFDFFMKDFLKWLDVGPLNVEFQALSTSNISKLNYTLEWFGTYFTNTHIMMYGQKKVPFSICSFSSVIHYYIFICISMDTA
jgi:hypothetical protein